MLRVPEVREAVCGLRRSQRSIRRGTTRRGVGPAAGIRDAVGIFGGPFADSLNGELLFRETRQAS